MKTVGDERVCQRTIRCSGRQVTQQLIQLSLNRTNVKSGEGNLRDFSSQIGMSNHLLTAEIYQL